jgi:hypothetical protein
MAATFHRSDKCCMLSADALQGHAPFVRANWQREMLLASTKTLQAKNTEHQAAIRVG